MSAHVAVYLRSLAEIRVAKDVALDAWGAMSSAERILALEGERDALLSLAAEKDAAGQRFAGDWHREDAKLVQERLDSARRIRCPECGQLHAPTHTEPEETR